MTEFLTFPGLGLEFEMNRVAFSIGSRPIYWYGIIIAVAFLVAAAYVLSRCKDFGLDGDRVMDVILGGVLFGIVGARIYYVIFEWSTYSQNPISALFIWEGGIAIYGGIIGGVIAAVVVCRIRKVKLLPMLDVAAGGLLLGQAIGRWGNFVNMEAFGCNTSVPWGMTSPSIEWYLKQNSYSLSQLGVPTDPSLPVHPTFLYESIWCLLGFIFIAWFTKRRRFDGELGLIYLAWYGLGRFFIEGLRTDSLLIGTIRVSQALAFVCVIAAGLMLVMVISKVKRANDPEFMPLYVNTDEGRAVLAGEFYKKKEAAVSEETQEEQTEERQEAQEQEAREDSGEDETLEVQNEQEDNADGDNN